MYDTYEYLPYKSSVIWSLNIEVIAKKQINTLGVTENRTGVSYSCPFVFFIINNCE